MLDRVFMKRTRRGNVLKIVREHYLREDISCGSELCRDANCTQAKSKIQLDQIPKSLSSKFTQPHYLVPDTNVILHQVIYFICLIYVYCYCQNNLYKFILFS